MSSDGPCTDQGLSSLRVVDSCVGVLAAELTKRADRFRPGSDVSTAWCSLNKGVVAELRRAARPLPVSAEALLESLARLRTILAGVSRLRGVQYHRWRGESSGVTGINFFAAANEVVQDGIVTRTLRMQTDYLEGEKIVDDLVEASDSALREVAAWMPEFLEIWSQFFMACKAVDEKVAERLWKEPEPSPWYRKLLQRWHSRRVAARQGICFSSWRARRLTRRSWHAPCAPSMSARASMWNFLKWAR